MFQRKSKQLNKQNKQLNNENKNERIISEF